MRCQGLGLVLALGTHSPAERPAEESLLRRVHAWESGSSCPDDFYKPIIATTFGTVTGAIWPVTSSRNADAEPVTGTGMDTLEILTRLSSSSVDDATLDGLRITVERPGGTSTPWTATASSVGDQYPGDANAADYLDQLKQLRSPAA